MEQKNPEQQEESRPVTEHQNLQNEVISEYDLCVILGIGEGTLHKIRDHKNFPTIILDSRNRVYLIKDVLDWLRNQPKETYVQHRPRKVKEEETT